MIASTQTNHPLAGGKTASGSHATVGIATGRLKAAGLRITQPRITILTALAKSVSPTSIEQLHGELGAGKCDLVTVYRCVAAFEEIGLVRRAFLHNGTALYELNFGQPTRYHVVCKTTNAVQELDAESSAILGRALSEIEDTLRAKGYADVGHLVEFFGHAPSAHRSSARPALAQPIIR
jgi:Fur family ferric uptake transcriptional regulator